jgi:arsenite methyltransferase
VAGALAERDFVEKLKRAGFTEIEVVERRPFGIDDADIYPLFTGELIELMRRTIPHDKHDRVATAVVVKARFRARSPQGVRD